MSVVLRTWPSRAAGIIAVTLVCTAPATAFAGEPIPARVVPASEAACTLRMPLAERSATWAAPLDRLISVQLGDTLVRDALERVAALGQLQLSYSNEFLPTGRRICVALDRVPVGAALEAILAGTTLRPIVVGTTQVVLAPTQVTAAGVAARPEVRRASVLDRVVVTGTPDGASQRGSPFAIDVIDRETLVRQRATTLGDALSHAMPGLWAWSGTAGTLGVRFGAVRGASSFGVSAPKLYLDGIEVANPLLVTQLDPARVDHIEVIRGPQGAALYGADAIDGVINIVMRHDGRATDAPAVQVTSTAGVAATAFAAGPAFVQDHAASVRGGVGHASYGAGLALGSSGATVAGASERRLLADGDLRVLLPRAVLTGIGRLSVQQSAASTSLIAGGLPLGSAARATRLTGLGTGLGNALAPTTPSVGSVDVASALLGDSITAQDMLQYTLGGTATIMPSTHWTHTAIVGADGYRLQGMSSTGLPMPAAATGAITDATGGADRGTLRLRSVGRFDLAARTLLSVTLAAEEAVARELVDTQGQALMAPVVVTGATGSTLTAGRNTSGQGQGNAGGMLSQGTAPLASRTVSSGGVMAQANLAWRDQWYLVAGGRLERSSGYSARPQQAALPLVGAAYVHDLGGVVVKVRGAYGTAIRPASALPRGASWMGRLGTLRSSALDPESQTGTEAGVDLLVGRMFTMHVTRFDQRASGLIQPVATTTTYATTAGRSRSMTYALENVGAIGNHGWELQATTTWRQLALAGALSVVDSRVDRLSSGYRGDLRVGDRMLEVPAQTLSLSAQWTASRWNANLMVTRASDWIGYDRLAIASALRDMTQERELTGAQLRQYWMAYDGITRVKATVAVQVIRDWSLLLGGDNLLNVQRGAPDNSAVRAGRTLTLGLRAGF